jgi:hypothetical protein
MSARIENLLNNASFGASLVMATVLAITLAFITWPRVANALGLETRPAPPPPAYAVGATIDTPAAWHAATPHTLVIFARASCGACEKAQPFLKALVAELQPRTTVVLVGGPETFTEDAAFGKAIGVADASMHPAPAGLRVRATPTLVLVDATGRILAAWEGVGPEDKQAVIAKAIRDSVAR